MTNADHDDAFYRVRVRGHLGEIGAFWFDDLRVTNQPDGVAEIAGNLVDQSALFGLLGTIQGLGLPLLGIERGPPEPQEAADPDEHELPTARPHNA